MKNLLLCEFGRIGFIYSRIIPLSMDQFQWLALAALMCGSTSAEWKGCVAQ
jgi:hypothetical protein